MELEPTQDPFSREAIEHLVARYGSPLLIIDAERVRRQYRRLTAVLPGVDLHYALKPLPHSSVINTLNAEGAFFDLATNGEVDLVRRLGISPERCIHTHPIKRDSDIRTALSFGVKRFVVDNPDELRKFTKFRGRASLLIQSFVPQPGRPGRPVPQIRLRSGGGRGSSAPCRGTAHRRGRTVLSYRLAKPRAGHDRQGHWCLQRTHRSRA